MPLETRLPDCALPSELSPCWGTTTGGLMDRASAAPSNHAACECWKTRACRSCIGENPSGWQDSRICGRAGTACCKRWQKIDDAGPVLVLMHNPDLFPEVPERVSLTLAGHTHGGQVDLPIAGRLIVPSRFGQRYAYGLVEENGKKLIVTGGIGTSILPVRFRVPPEVVILTLIPQ